MEPVDQPNIYKAFALTASRHAGKTAVSFLGTEYSYSDLLVLTERFAGALAAVGLKQGDRAVMYIPNSIQFAVAWLGLQRLGALPVPITPIYTPPDLKYIANDTGAKAVICSDRNYGYVMQAMPETSVEQVIVTNLADLLPLWKRVFGFLADKVPSGKVERAPHTSFMRSMLSSSHPPAPQPDVGEGEIAEILYTGGTTKHPKGVPLTHGFFLVSSDEQLSVRDPLFSKNEDVVLGGAPLFHILGQTCSLATIVVGGGTLILLPRVNLDAVFDSIQRTKTTTL
ncbi:MAG: acyl--CoA ligase, partial [Deltaproteobacteria bacterium]|nr:acyl--CoA ligase [Deltaproteobacteria bacterium]